MYNAKKTFSKSAEEGAIIAVVTAVAVVVSTKAKQAGIDIPAEALTIIIVSGTAAAWRGISNWIKNRKGK